MFPLCCKIAVIVIIISLLFSTSTGGDFAKVGSNGECLRPDGSRGLCKIIIECEPLLRLLIKGKSRPQPRIIDFLRRSHCGFEGKDPVVCCPVAVKPKDDHTDLNLTVKNPVYEKYLNKSCGAVQALNKVIGGSVTALHEFPWMALIRYKTSKSLSIHPPYRINIKTLEERLQPPGISTSSNSSWTFSNSHCDVPKPKKGRLCGIFLIGAVLVVALAVIAIAGLAFYIGGYTTERHHVSEYQTKDHIGAKRQYSNKQIETTPKVTTRHTLKTTSEVPEELSSTQSTKLKTVPEGAIIGLSETMQQLNGLKNKKKEETTTETPEDISTEYAIEEDDEPDSVTDIELVPEKPSNTFKLDDANTETTYEVVKNGHARPSFAASTTTTITTTPTIQPPKQDYSDEPWRPIIPSYRDAIRIKNPYKQHQEKVIDHRYGPLIEPVIENDSPITFSRESYEQNLRITPEYAGYGNKFNFHNNHNSRISDEIAVKYKDLVKDHKIGSSEGIAEVVVTSDDIVTAPPAKPSDVIIISELGTSSTLSTYYNATKDSGTAENVKKPLYPIGVDQMLSGISVIESKVETSKSAVTPITTIKAVPKTTPHTTVTGTPKATQQTTTKTTPQTTIKTTPRITTKATVKAMTTTLKSTNAPAINETKMTTTDRPKATAATIEAVTRPQTTPSTGNQTTSKTSEVTTPESNATVKNPFLDDSRSSSSTFNFGLPDLPILKQFHHLDSLLKSFSKPETGNQFSKYMVRSDFVNETTVTRFPVRTKQTTVKNYKKDDTIFVEVSTISAEPTTRSKPVTIKPVVIKGEVEVVPGPVKQTPALATTEIPKLITLLPVRSNVNMMRPLRPRPKSNINSTITVTTSRKSKMSSEFKTKEPPDKQQLKTSEALYAVPYQQHEFVDDKNGKRWIYYSSSKQKETPKNEKLFIVTPEPKAETGEPENDTGFLENLTNLPLYNTIETLLNSDYRNKDGKNRTVNSPEEKNQNGGKNTSEIIDEIVKIVENVAISTADSSNVIVKVNQTVLNRTTHAGEDDKKENDSTNRNEIGISTKAISTHYKLNQAGVPVLTKVLNKAHSFEKQTDEMDSQTPTELNEIKDCGSDSIKCGNGTCLPLSKKCNQFIDCPDAADEKNCTCAEHLKAQQLHRKLCDGVVDCWDFSDEFNCEWCQEEFLCSNSRICIKKDQICDGTNNCPFGDDERNCVTVSPSRTEAETFNYHHNGYLMIRKNGRWGKLCIDNFESVSLKSKTGWKISDLGRTVCKALTFKDFDKVEKMISVPNEGRSVGGGDTEKYYELAYNEVSNDQHTSRDSVLSFHETECTRKEVVKVTCTDLECGLRPQATNQWSSRRSRIVGGGNAGPGSWPWQAALYKEGEFQCGATLISENWLISAGHCFYHNQEAYWVARLGTLRTTLLLPSPYEQLRQISKIILHPQYIDNGFINDISLLKMRDPVKFTDYVRPICLPKPDATIVDGSMCTVVGWGQLSEAGWVFPDTLQEVQLPILSSHECRKRTIFLPLYKITDDMFCAGYERGGRDACLGDSGGPLMCQEADGKWSLLGVTSNGYGCARSNRPGVYTKVSKYLQWIQAQMALHSESLLPAIENEEKQSPSTSRNFTEFESEQNSSEKHEEIDYVIKLISQRVSNVKLNSDSGKGRDKCKGHRCPLGECLPQSRLCNGHIECSDGSDEKDCW